MKRRRYYERPAKQFFDKNDYQEYANMSLAELINEETEVIRQIRQTQSPETTRYLKKDLETIQRVMNDFYSNYVKLVDTKS